MNVQELVYIFQAEVNDMGAARHHGVVHKLHSAMREIEGRMVSRAGGWNREAFETRVTAGDHTEEFELPGDFLSLIRCEMISNGKPHHVFKTISFERSFGDFGAASSPDVARNVVFVNAQQTVGVIRPCSSGTMRVWYYRESKPILALTDEPELPRQFQYLIALLAAANALKLEGSPTRQLDERVAGGMQDMAYFMDRRGE
jgi:hypothetical protein